MSWTCAIQPAPGAVSPLSQQASPSEVGTTTATTSSKRKYTSTACEYCRFKRKRCDGKPRCRSCVDANNQCVYRFNDKRKASVRQEGIQVLEAQNEELRSLLDVLKYGTDEESLAALQALRGSQEPAHRRSSSNLLLDIYGMYLPTLPSLSLKDLEQLQADQGSRQSRHPAQPLSWPTLRFFDYPTVFVPSQLPPEVEIRKGAELFLQVTAGLFHVMTLDEFDELCNQAFRPQSPPDSRVVARICAVAAIGAHFNVDDTTGELKDALFNTAIHHMPELVELGNLQAMKYLACLCAYGMIDKRKTTARLIQLGLQIARWNLALPLHELTGDAHEWTRLYRTMMFFECWLSTSLGYMSDLCAGEVDFLQPVTPTLDGLQDDSVTQIKAKEIIVLRARVCKATCGLEPPTEQMIEEHMTALEGWYRKLPPNMTLTVLLNGDADPLTAAQQGALLLSHAMYLGAVMMLHRRVLVAVSDGILGHARDTDIWSAPVQEHLVHSVEAARAIVRIFILLRFGTATTNMHVRCWICVFETYTACTILLYNIALRTIQHAAQRAETQLDLERVTTCLGMLEASALVDKVSQKMWAALAAVHHAVVVSTGHQGYPISPPEAVEPRSLSHSQVQLLHGTTTGSSGLGFEQHGLATPSLRSPRGCLSAIQAFKRATDMLRDPFGHGLGAGFRLLPRGSGVEALDWWSAAAA
ncbi:hypothetical protein, variant 1 [Cladophialophora immunda]|uniref:Zn(2)-C6 fungal-type domain-containing protein n=1 Tax=Cladophialophora immunda TaxID=569365 RepID=A0A0D2C7V7_9EURO|nr:hypothetical protein, variant 1 [Cladophialophora immunda]KIW27238.1 hypothetical protein, variant 1 [Cladophialophora immunda]OQV02025.1 hypothetical protein CLAIMM_07282 [Cladophialophora immunda]